MGSEELKIGAQEMLTDEERKRIVDRLRRTHNAQLTLLLERKKGLRPNTAAEVSFAAWDTLKDDCIVDPRLPFLPLAHVTRAAIVNADARLALH